MAKAYLYDAFGYFAGENDDYGLLPNNATYEAPEAQDGYIPRWTGAAWEQVENHKGREGWLDGQPHTVKDYGPLPEGWTAEKPAPEPLTLEEARAAAFDALAARRWKAETAGISISGMAIPTDRESQALITGAVAGALIDPEQIIKWKTAARDDNGAPISVPLDADTIKAVAMAVRAHVQACFDIESDKGAELGALPDQEAIQAWLDTELDAGWPDSRQAEEAG